MPAEIQTPEQEPELRPWQHKLAEFIAWFFAKALYYFVDFLDKPLKGMFGYHVKKILEIPDLPESMRKLLENYNSEGHPGMAILGTSMAAGAGSAGLFSVLTPGLEAAKQWSSQLDRWQLLPEMQALILWNRGDITEDKVDEVYQKLGYHDWQITEIKKLRFIRLDPESVKQIWLRAKTEYEKWWKDLRDQGWDEDRINVLKELANIIPPLADMVRFADFGAFDPEIIAKWREFYDAPAWIREPMSLIGITQDWANKYWFSHWRQPGRYELGEMRRRDLIDDDTVLKAYLTQGFSEFWQNLLLKLAWEPYTRVDVRRMYKVGVLERADLERAYRDLGYDEEKAKNLADFTEKYYARPPASEEDEEDREIARVRDLTRTDMTDGYRRGMLARPEATEMLSTIGYEPDEIDFYLDREDLKRDQGLKDAYASNYRQLYVTGIVDDEVVKSDLTTLGLESAEVDELLKLWYIERIRRLERPTRTSLASFLRKGIITEQEFEGEMAGLGYSDKYTAWYLEEVMEQILAVPPPVTRPPTRTSLGSLFRNGIITEAEYKTEMAQLGYTDEYITWCLDELIQKITVVPEVVVRLPSRSSLASMLRKGVIDETQWKAEMTKLGYSEKYITWYLEEIKA